MDDQGWIKLHRKMKDWEWYNDANTFRLFIHILLEANHEDHKWRGILVKKGTFITGRKSLAKSLNISQRSIRTSLNKLKSTNEIAIKTTNKYSISQVQKWEMYQQNDQQNDQQTVQRVTSKRPASDHKQELKKYIDNKLSISVGNTPSNGNAEINLILEEFKKRIGRIPADKYERRVAQHVRLLINGFIKRNGVVFLKLRGRELTLGYVLEKSWDWYMKKEYAPSTEKLEAYKLRLKVFLDLHETRLKQEGGDLYGIK